MLLVDPLGGLGNRLMALMSARILAEQVGCDIRTAWEFAPDHCASPIEALITSSQARVTGETRVRLAPGRFQVVGTRSPHSMMDTSIATYGEENRLWSGDEARAFARVSAVPSLRYSDSWAWL